MRRIALYLFRLPHPRKPGRYYTTRHRMTDEDAAARHPTAIRLDHTVEYRDIPDEPMGPGHIVPSSRSD